MGRGGLHSGQPDNKQSLVVGAGASMSEEGGGRMEGSHHWPPVRDSSPGRNHPQRASGQLPFFAPRQVSLCSPNPAFPLY